MKINWKKLRRSLKRKLSEARYGILRPLSDAWYWIRTHTYNRYHIVNCKDPSNGYEWGWRDRDQLILLASFKIFKDFVEQEYPSNIDWDYNDEYRAAKAELEYLYKWWTEIRPSQIKDWKPRRIWDQDKEDQEHLLRLIAIRGRMWT